MNLNKRVYVLDSNAARRASLTRTCLNAQIHAEPCEDVGELISAQRQDGFILYSETGRPRDLENLLDITSSINRRLPVICYAEDPSPQQIVAAMMSGALSYLVWPIDEDAVRSALTLRTEQRFMVELRNKKAENARLVASLTKREREVLKQITLGNSSKAMARELGISYRTVEVHRASLLKKLGSRGTSDAVRIGVYAGLDVEDADSNAE